MTGEDQTWLESVTARLASPTATEIVMLVTLTIGGLALLAYLILTMMIVEGWQ